MKAKESTSFAAAADDDDVIQAVAISSVFDMPKEKSYEDKENCKLQYNF